jgi:hypothetical protein
MRSNWFGSEDDDLRDLCGCRDRDVSRSSALCSVARVMMWLGALMAVGGIVWMGSRSFRHSQPGRLQDLPERVSVNHLGHRWFASNWLGLALTLLGIALVVASKTL